MLYGLKVGANAAVVNVQKVLSCAFLYFSLLQEVLILAVQSINTQYILKIFPIYFFPIYFTINTPKTKNVFFAQNKILLPKIKPTKVLKVDWITKLRLTNLSCSFRCKWNTLHYVKDKRWRSLHFALWRGWGPCAKMPFA